MEEGSKRRLVGTAVVLMLLVIFLPMLLEQEPGNPVPDTDLQIPPRPAFDEGFDPTLAEPPAQTFAVPTPPEPQTVPADVPLAPQLPPPEMSQPAPPVVEPEPEPVASQPEAPPPATTQPPREAPRTAGNLASWVIQVAALAEQARAKALEQDLRAKGFPAFVEKAVVGGKTYHRIRVGPEIDRREIEATAASLREKTGLEGQIQRYP